MSILNYIKRYPTNIEHPNKKIKLDGRRLYHSSAIKKPGYSITYHIDHQGYVDKLGTIACHYQDCSATDDLYLTYYNNNYVFICKEHREKLNHEDR